MTVKLESQFVPISYPGYFWNTEDKYLYSCKSGVLKRLKKEVYKYPYKHFDGPYFKISHLGERRVLPLTRLIKDYQKEELQEEVFIFPYVEY